MPVVSRDEFGIPTSNPLSEALHQGIDPEDIRPPRLHVASFDGTLAGGLWSSRRTVIPTFVNLISPRENVYDSLLNGVGADGSWTDFFMGGVGGWGTLRNVVIALKSLSKNYLPGDRIIFNGYSRGAWAARYLALLISLIGLPKDGDEKLFHRIYKACSNDTIWKEGVAASLMNGYECWENVRINALCCFDTVGSLGVPLTGLAKPLSILRRWRKKPDNISDVAPNVYFAFHALALHELREPFAPTLMRGPSPRTHIHQVSFPGAHGNLGWITSSSDLVHGPLAWMIQQIHTHLGIRFSERKLAETFPHYRSLNPTTATSSTSTSTSTSIETTHERNTRPMWYNGEAKRTSTLSLAIIGKRLRKPGRVNLPNGTTDLKIHIGARLRNHGATENDHAVPGYVLMAPATGRPFWALRKGGRAWGSWPRRSGSSRSGGSSSSDGVGEVSVRVGTWSSTGTGLVKSAAVVEEAPVGELEARCLGLPVGVVRV